MKLSRALIKNFRCIESLEIAPEGFTTLIGPNNAGKSATMRALEIFLNHVTPDLDEWREGHRDDPIEIEVEFDELQDWERLKPGVSALVHDNCIRLRMRILPPSNARKKIEIEYECFKPEETIVGWAESWGDLDPIIKKKATDSGVTGATWRSTAGKEQVKQIVRNSLPERITVGDLRWTSDGISIPAALEQALPQAQMIAAVRDAQDDCDPGAATSFGLLLKSIILPAVSASEEYTGLIAAITALEQKLKGDGVDQIPEVQELANSISRRLSDLIEAKISFGMEPPNAEKFVGSNTLIQINDGTKTRIGLQGHGLQRALVFAMLEVIATRKSVTKIQEGGAINCRRTILLFEEPELFIHPHLMRRFKDVLTKISKMPDWQVIITTHSPFLIDVAQDPCSLVIHRRNNSNSPPKVTQLSSDPFAEAGKHEERERLRAVLDFHPTICEAFFARHVVLVEGDTELATFVRQEELYRIGGINLEIQRETTIVSCDGKWTIIPVARLLKAFGVPFRILHDTDRKGLTDNELNDDRKHEWHANALIAELVEPGNLFSVEDTFEHVLWEANAVPKGKKDKPYRAWKRVRELCNGKNDLDHAPKLKDVLNFVFKPFAR